LKYNRLPTVCTNCLRAFPAGPAAWFGIASPAGAARTGHGRAHFLFPLARIFPAGRTCFPPGASKTPILRSLPATAYEGMEAVPGGTTRPGGPNPRKMPFFSSPSAFLRQLQRLPGSLALFFGPTPAPPPLLPESPGPTRCGKAGLRAHHAFHLRRTECGNREVF
jgi:hypothetical protein